MLQSSEMALAHRGGLANTVGCYLIRVLLRVSCPLFYSLFSKTNVQVRLFRPPELTLPFPSGLNSWAAQGRATPSEPHSTHKLMT